MHRLKTLDLDLVWQKEQGWTSERKIGRKFDDKEELAFWEQFAKYYAHRYNLYKEMPVLVDKLHGMFGEHKRIIDLGCGSGNFALPMARYAQEILGIDFSPAMLKNLKLRAQREKITNIKTICTKWEDYQGDYDADFVLAVNSLYRVCYMKLVLEKIVKYGKQGFAIVRTLQRPYLYKVYRSLQLTYNSNNDYMLVPTMLWDMNVNANVEFMTYYKPLHFETWDEVSKLMLKDLGEFTYLNYGEQLQANFTKMCTATDRGYDYQSKRIVEIISYIKK